jgi:hypothetical protein
VKYDITWLNIQKLYLANHSAINEIVSHINLTYKIPKKVIRDQIKKELIVFTEKTPSANVILNFLKYYSSLFFVFFSGIIFVFTKKQRIDCDVLYEELWDRRSLFSRFYVYIDKFLSSSLNSSVLLNFPGYSQDTQLNAIEGLDGKKVFDVRNYNVLYDYKIAFKFSILDFFYIKKLFSLKTKKLNILILYLKLIRKILIYKTQSSLINTKVLISASDYYWNPFKYYFFKKSGIENIFLIQHNFVGDYITNNFYLSCDYYFAHSQMAINKKIGFYNKKQFPIGSLQLSPFLNTKKNILYDILIIDQPVHELVMVASREGGSKKDIIHQYYIFLNNLKNYLIVHKNKNVVYILKPGAFKKESFLNISDIFANVKNITFKEVYGKETFTCISQSELIINMYSSVGVEAYGLSKRVLWINYNNCCDIFKYDTENEDLHILINDSSYEAFEKKVNLLLSKNKDIDEHYNKLKEKYMNIQENPAKIVADKVLELLKVESV